MIEKAKGAIRLVNLNQDDCQSTASVKRRHSNEHILNCKTAKKTLQPMTHKRDPDVSVSFKLYDNLRILFIEIPLRICQVVNYDVPRPYKLFTRRRKKQDRQMSFCHHAIKS